MRDKARRICDFLFPIRKISFNRDYISSREDVSFDKKDQEEIARTDVKLTSFEGISFSPRAILSRAD